jgi:hypothetical protein
MAGGVTHGTVSLIFRSRVSTVHHEQSGPAFSHARDAQIPCRHSDQNGEILPNVGVHLDRGAHHRDPIPSEWPERISEALLEFDTVAYNIESLAAGFLQSSSSMRLAGIIVEHASDVRGYASAESHLHRKTLPKNGRTADVRHILTTSACYVHSMAGMAAAATFTEAEANQFHGAAHLYGKALIQSETARALPGAAHFCDRVHWVCDAVLAPRIPKELEAENPAATSVLEESKACRSFGSSMAASGMATPSARPPRTNKKNWSPKLLANIERDQRNTAALQRNAAEAEFAQPSLRNLPKSRAPKP